MQKKQWLLTAAFVVGLGGGSLIFQKPLLAGVSSVFSRPAFAMWELPACARQNADMTVVGYEAESDPESVILSIAVTVPLDDPDDVRFEAAHRQLFICLSRYPWKHVTLIYLRMQKVDTMDGGSHYVAEVSGILGLSGEAIQTLDLEQPLVAQIVLALKDGAATWTSSFRGEGFSFQHNADWQLAIQRFEKVYGK